MKNQILKSVLIDLTEFNLNLTYKGSTRKPLVVHFDKPGRRFYLALIALIIIKMKSANRCSYINIYGQEKDLELLDKGLNGQKASPSHSTRLDKCHKMWKERLLNLGKATSFVIKNRSLIKYRKAGDSKYDCREDEKVLWSALFAYNNEPGKKWIWKFAVDEVGIGLDDVTILFNKHKDIDAWGKFKANLKIKDESEIIKNDRICNSNTLKVHLCALLENLEAELSTIRIFHPPYTIDLNDIYIPVNVTTETDFRPNTESLKIYTDPEEDLRKTYFLKGGKHNNPLSTPWHKIFRQLGDRNIMVLADPGMGKTTLLKQQAHISARQQRANIEEDCLAIEKIEIPLFFKLQDLANSKYEIFETAISLIRRNNSIYKDSWVDIITNKLQSGKCVLFLDALDEVPPKLRNSLAEKIRRFINNFSCKIICTSRLVGFQGIFLHDPLIVEIIPFNREQIKQYLQAWFQKTDKDHMSKRIFSDLDKKPQLMGLAQNPLFLSLLCSLSSKKNFILPNRRCIAYEQVIDYFFKRWSQTKKYQTDSRIISKILLLEELAYHFSNRNQLIFELSDLLEWMRDYINQGKALTGFSDADSVITELITDDGILVKLDAEDDRYIFLHKTFQEFFTASYLARLIKTNYENGLAIIKPKYRDFNWNETVALLSGLIEDPIPLISDIYHEKDDVFYSMLILVGNCISEIGEIYNELVEDFFDRLFKAWYSKTYHPLLRRVLESVGKVNSSFIYFLVNKIKTASKDEKKYAFRAIKEIGNPLSIKLLRPLIKRKNRYIQREVIELASEFRDDKSVPSLINVLKSKHSHLRKDAVAALGYIGDPNVVPAINIALYDKKERVRSEAIETLGKIGSPDCIRLLLKFLKSKYFNYFSMRNAAYALGNINNPIVEMEINKIVESNDKDLLEAAAVSLGQIGGNTAIETLKKLYETGNPQVVKAVIEAFKVIGDDSKGKEDIIPILMRAMKNNSTDIKLSAIKALGSVGNYYKKEVLHVLHQGIEDEDPDIRSQSIWWLGIIGDKSSIKYIMKCLQDENRTAIKDALDCIDLGNFKDKIFKKESIRLLEEIDPIDSIFAIKALKNFPSNDAINALHKYLGNSKSNYKEAALHALGEMKSHKSYLILTKYINHNNKFLKSAAAEAMGKIGQKKYINHLIRALDSDSKDVRKVVITSLKKICDSETHKKLMSSSEIDIANDDFYELLLYLFLKQRYKNFPS